MKPLLEIYNYAEDFFNNKINDADTKMKKYAKKSFKSILELTKDILRIDNYDNFSRGSKVILKTIIETAVDLENLEKIKDYVKIMELMSLKEEVVFVKYYNGYLTRLLPNNNDYNNKKIDKLDRKKKEIVKSIDGDYNKITKTYYKFDLLSDRNRHDKYKMFFDILSFYCHNNIHAFKKKGIKNIKDIPIEEYEDIIGSILKNGLTNLAKIYGIESLIDKNFLKETKKKIKNQEEEFGIEDLFYSYTLDDEYDFE